MAMIFCNTLFSSPPLLSPLTSTQTKPSRSSKNLIARAQSQSMEDHIHDDPLRQKFMEFPYVTATRKQLMVDIISTVEDHFQPLLLPCSLPPDVRNFKNPNGSAEASIYIRSGEKSSPIDFFIGSWVHGKIPTGVTLNITTVSAFLKSSTNAPNFTLEVIQTSPTSLILILDLPHRTDLVLNPDYIKEYYQDTNLDSYRQSLLKLPGVKPYVSPSLFVRCVVSPAASVLKIDVEEEEQLEEIWRDHVGPAAKEILGVWFERCAREDDEEKRVMGEEERMELERRDKSFRLKNIEDDLDFQFPILFGEEVSSRVLHVIKEAFGVL
ncbi:unnamed protein product [Microthlaspi erraticum]|uniref:Red chlorophyll catabolite reductase n=1 Tax=Microthlaspi erraticum TaxID=1685480 RepID=A0A6D2J7U2_9BRAS|nr:unnamed protein product [Microthlaspi erraticum]